MYLGARRESSAVFLFSSPVGAIPARVKGSLRLCVHRSCPASYLDNSLSEPLVWLFILGLDIPFNPRPGPSHAS